MMWLYRLCKEAHSPDVLSGEGGLVDRGRWHSRGRRVVYCASVEALAVLEVRVSLGNEVPSVPYLMHIIEVPDAAVSAIDTRSLPPDWNAVPAESASRRIGDVWLISLGSAGLRVPSIHTRTDFNVLLNPAHPEFSRARVLERHPYPFDRRLLPAPSPRRRH